MSKDNNINEKGVVKDSDQGQSSNASPQNPTADRMAVGEFGKLLDDLKAEVEEQIKGLEEEAGKIIKCLAQAGKVDGCGYHRWARGGVGPPPPPNFAASGVGEGISHGFFGHIK